MDGWDVVGEIDPRIYQRSRIGSPNADLEWSGRKLSCGQEQVANNKLNEVLIVNLVDRLPQDQLVPFWRELYKACAPAAIVRLIGVYYTCLADIQADPTRLRGLSEKMLLHLSSGGRKALLADPLEDGVSVALFHDIDFEPVRVIHIADPEWEARADEAKAWNRAHSLNVVRRMDATLVVHKPCRE